MSLSLFVFSCKSCRVWDRRATPSTKSISSREENSVHLIPRAGHSIVFFITSMAMLNRTADIIHPCLTPDVTLNAISD